MVPADRHNCSGRRGDAMKNAELTYLVNPSPCCYGYGYVELVDIDYQPYDRVACWCAKGKDWAAKREGSR